MWLEEGQMEAPHVLCPIDNKQSNIFAWYGLDVELKGKNIKQLFKLRCISEILNNHI